MKTQSSFNTWFSKLRLGNDLSFKIWVWYAVKVLKWPFVIIHRNTKDVEGVTFSRTSPEKTNWMSFKKKKDEAK